MGLKANQLLDISESLLNILICNLNRFAGLFKHIHVDRFHIVKNWAFDSLLKISNSFPYNYLNVTVQGSILSNSN